MSIDGTSTRTIGNLNDSNVALKKHRPQFQWHSSSRIMKLTPTTSATPALLTAVAMIANGTNEFTIDRKHQSEIKESQMRAEIDLRVSENSEKETPQHGKKAWRLRKLLSVVISMELRCRYPES